MQELQEGTLCCLGCCITNSSAPHQLCKSKSGFYIFLWETFHLLFSFCSVIELAKVTMEIQLILQFLGQKWTHFFPGILLLMMILKVTFKLAVVKQTESAIEGKDKLLIISSGSWRMALLLFLLLALSSTSCHNAWIIWGQLFNTPKLLPIIN